MVDDLRQHSWLMMGLIALLLATALGVVSDHRYQAITVACYGFVALTALAAAWPERFMVVAVLLLLFPYTWSPEIGLFNSVLPPFALVIFPAGLAAFLMISRNRLRMTLLDWLVCALVLSALLSEINAGANSGLDQILLETLFLPYFAFRLIFTAWPQILQKLPNVLMAVGVCLSLFAIWEVLRGSSPFAHSSLTNAKLIPWAVDYPRGGVIRAAATMGHPIAFGSFLLIPIIFAFAQRRWRVFGLCMIGEALTLSRGPYIAVIAALALFSLLTGRTGRLWVAAAILCVLALFVAPVQTTISQSFEGGSEANTNALYRSELLKASLAAPTLLGNPTPQASSLYGHPGQFQLSDVTSEFALITGRQGLLGLAIWLGMLGAFAGVVIAGRNRGDPLLLTCGVILIGEWISLLSVALITSFGYVFLMLTAMAAARLSGADTVATPATSTSVAWPSIETP